MRRYRETNPGNQLDRAERFLLSLDTCSGLEARLNFWRFRKDWEGAEKEILKHSIINFVRERTIIFMNFFLASSLLKFFFVPQEACEPLAGLRAGLELVKASGELRQLLGLSLAAGNLLNRSRALAFHIQDLHKLELMKDKTKTKSLLYHIVKEAIEQDSDFSGFSKDFIQTFELISKTDFNAVKAGVEEMEKECRTSLKYILVQQMLNMDKDSGFGEFIKNVAERIITIKRIEELVLARYWGLLAWLGLAPSPELGPQQFGQIMSDFSRAVGRQVGDLTLSVLYLHCGRWRRWGGRAGPAWSPPSPTPRTPSTSRPTTLPMPSPTRTSNAVLSALQRNFRKWKVQD